MLTILNVQKLKHSCYLKQFDKCSMLAAQHGWSQESCFMDSPQGVKQLDNAVAFLEKQQQPLAATEKNAHEQRISKIQRDSYRVFFFPFSFFFSFFCHINISHIKIFF